MDKKIMKKTYKISLPKGASICTIETNENNGVLEVTVGIEKKYEPKDGDVVYSPGIFDGVIAIYAGTNETGGIMTYAALHGQRLQTVVSERGWGYTSDYRPANEAEKQLLFNALAEQGKRWNAEKKCIEDLPRWRAVCSGLYYIVDTDFFIREMEEKGERTDCALYNAGNYFRTREAAEKVAGQIRDIFKNSKAE